MHPGALAEVGAEPASPRKPASAPVPDPGITNQSPLTMLS
jgi:hypothetical protein